MTERKVGDKVKYRNIKTKRTKTGTIRKVEKKNNQTRYEVDGGKSVYNDDIVEGYRPGVTPLTRELSFNDHPGDSSVSGKEDYEKVKRIKWPYGIDVKFNDRTRSVRFKTAKMKTVARLLDKHIDFGAISAGEALDLPMELMMSEQNVSEAARGARLDKENPVIPADETAAKFARQYAAGMKGDYRDGGPTPADERNAEKFWSMYDDERVNSTFAGSGETRYTNKKTGESFMVVRSANGKGFHGTDHLVSKEETVEEGARFKTQYGYAGGKKEPTAKERTAQEKRAAARRKRLAQKYPNDPQYKDNQTQESKIDEVSSDMAQRYKKRADMDQEFNDADIERWARKSRYGTDDDADQARDELKRLHKRNSKRQTGKHRANKRIAEEEGNIVATTSLGRADVNIAHYPRDNTYTAHVTDERLARKIGDLDQRFGSLDDAIQHIDISIEELYGRELHWQVNESDLREATLTEAAKIACTKCDAVSTAAAWKKNDGVCPKCKKSSQGVAEATLTEGVLDDIDDDGFMAKRQLYDLAKYATQLHKTIQDTDELEPWVQAKITKAADYIDTVKHYLEYRDVRDADNAADQLDMPVADPIEEPVALPVPEEEFELDYDIDAARIYENMLAPLRGKLKKR